MLQVVSLEEALKKVPIPPMPMVVEREKDFDDEQLVPDFNTNNDGDEQGGQNNYDMDINWK